MLIQLSKPETEKLELNSQRIAHIEGTKFELYMALTMWYAVHNLNAGGAKKEWEKMTEILGMKPNYYKNYKYRNAVWGLKLEEKNIDFIIYLCQGGLTIQMDNKGLDYVEFNKNEIARNNTNILIQFLFDKICGGRNIIEEMRNKNKNEQN